MGTARRSVKQAAGCAYNYLRIYTGFRTSRTKCALARKRMLDLQGFAGLLPCEYIYKVRDSYIYKVRDTYIQSSGHIYTKFGTENAACFALRPLFYRCFPLSIPPCCVPDKPRHASAAASAALLMPRNAAVYVDKVRDRKCRSNAPVRLVWSAFAGFCVIITLPGQLAPAALHQIGAIKQSIYTKFGTENAAVFALCALCRLRLRVFSLSEQIPDKIRPAAIIAAAAASLPILCGFRRIIPQPSEGMRCHPPPGALIVSGCRCRCAYSAADSKGFSAPQHLLCR